MIAGPREGGRSRLCDRDNVRFLTRVARPSTSSFFFGRRPRAASVSFSRFSASSCSLRKAWNAGSAQMFASTLKPTEPGRGTQVRPSWGFRSLFLQWIRSDLRRERALVDPSAPEPRRRRVLCVASVRPRRPLRRVGTTPRVVPTPELPSAPAPRRRASRVGATPFRRRGRACTVPRVATTAAASSRRRGPPSSDAPSRPRTPRTCEVDALFRGGLAWRRVAAAPRLRRGYSVEAATVERKRSETSAPR